MAKLGRASLAQGAAFTLPGSGTQHRRARNPSPARRVLRVKPRSGSTPFGPSRAFSPAAPLPPIASGAVFASPRSEVLSPPGYSSRMYSRRFTTHYIIEAALSTRCIPGAQCEGARSLLFSPSIFAAPERMTWVWTRRPLLKLHSRAGSASSRAGPAPPLPQHYGFLPGPVPLGNFACVSFSELRVYGVLRSSSASRRIFRPG